MPSIDNCSLSLIYLVYNEEATLPEVLDEAIAFCESDLKVGWQILVVDDGSSDRSNSIAQYYASQVPGIEVVTHPRNRGMGAAMASGIAAATCDYFSILSADGQAPVAELRKLLRCLERSDIVLSTYEQNRSVTRAVLSRGLRLLMRVTAGISFELEGLYLFPTVVAQRLAPLSRSDTFFFSFELIDRALAEGFTVGHTTMEYRTRQAGASKVANLKRIAKVAKEAWDYSVRKNEG